MNEFLKPNQEPVVSNEKLSGTISEQIKTAEKILGKYVLGPDAIEATFNFKPEDKEIPAIPFSEAELQRAKELDQFLVLRVDKAKDGLPLTMEKMDKLKEGKTKDGDRILPDKSWCEYQVFFTKDTPILGWALVSKDVIPSSFDQNYLDQTTTLVDYLQNQVFKDQKLDKVYQGAIDEFNEEKDKIKEIMGFVDSRVIAEELKKLKITDLCRQSPADALYDMLLMKEKNNKYTLSEDTWTKGQYSGDGLFVMVGHDKHSGSHQVSGFPPEYKKNDGLHVVSGVSPEYKLGYLGAVFSRTQ